MYIFYIATLTIVFFIVIAQMYRKPTRSKIQTEYEPLYQQEQEAFYDDATKIVTNSNYASNFVVYLGYVLLFAAAVTGLSFASKNMYDMGVARTNITSLQINTVTITQANAQIDTVFTNSLVGMANTQSQIVAQHVQVGSLTNRIQMLETSHALMRFDFGSVACQATNTAPFANTIAINLGGFDYLSTNTFTLAPVTNIIDPAFAGHAGYGAGHAIMFPVNGSADIYTVDYTAFCRGPINAVPLTTNSYTFKLLTGTITSNTMTVQAASSFITPWLLESNYGGASAYYTACASGKYVTSAVPGTAVAFVHSQIGGPSAISNVCVFNIDIKKIQD